MAGPAHGKKAFLSDIVVTNTRDHVLLYFTVNNCFNADMNTAIESGIETTFTFFVQLYEKRPFLWDRKLADLEISHSIKYDQIKNLYEVRLSEQKGKAVVVKSYDEAQRLMAEVAALKVVEIQQLMKEGHYQIRMMAQLNKIQLPLYLHYVFFFLSLWDFETDWHSVDFRY
ncbi:MAG: DUF4390 domain-containing protein [Deltaproteobacteria bacterium]|nr:DUF4390 domain-containing protein [Deltaproteobacteria bacterium]